MKQATVNNILPNIYLDDNLAMAYPLPSPEFIISYYQSNNSSHPYQFIGLTISLLFFINYLVKSLLTVPHSVEMADIMPHVLAMKAAGFLIFPTYVEFVYYCFGFMVFELPWGNSFFSKVMGVRKGEIVPSAYGLFYESLQIGAVYGVGMCLCVAVGVGYAVHRMCFTSQTSQKVDQGKNSKKTTPAIVRVLGNTLFLGATWASSLSLQGALLNPIQQLSLNSGLYMLGIGIYCAILSFTLYQLYISFADNFSMARALIKVSLLTWANVSPIYLFTLAIAVDCILIPISYRLLHREYPKVWAIKHYLLNVCLVLLAMFPSSLTTLLLVSILLVVVLTLDLATHLKEYRDPKQKVTMGPK